MLEEEKGNCCGDYYRYDTLDKAMSQFLEMSEKGCSFVLAHLPVASHLYAVVIRWGVTFLLFILLFRVWGTLLFFFQSQFFGQAGRHIKGRFLYCAHYFTHCSGEFNDLIGPYNQKCHEENHQYFCSAHTH